MKVITLIISIFGFITTAFTQCTPDIVVDTLGPHSVKNYAAFRACDNICVNNLPFSTCPGQWVTHVNDPGNINNIIIEFDIDFMDSSFVLLIMDSVCSQVIYDTTGFISKVVFPNGNYQVIMYDSIGDTLPHKFRESAEAPTLLNSNYSCPIISVIRPRDKPMYYIPIYFITGRRGDPVEKPLVPGYYINPDNKLIMVQ